MRQIKFRAWSKEHKRMFSNDLLEQSLGGLLKIAKKFVPNKTHGKEGLYLPLKDEDLILMQFTGLLDKNGNEIYEGDIVSIPLDGDETRVFEVAIETVVREVVSHPSFDSATARVAITGVVFKWKGYELFPCVNKGVHDNEKMEVIGNIYQNPDLLQAI